jgi:hypothetical protein
MLNSKKALVAAAGAAVLVSGVVLWSRATSASNATPTVTAVKSAVTYAHSRGERGAVAVYDRYTGQSWASGDVHSYYASASVVKVFIAARLLLSGQMHGSIAQTAARMIEYSDDDAATSLYGRVGGDQLYRWVSSRFHIPVAPPPDAGYWGETRITADGMISFYRQMASISAGSWLMTAMGHYSCTAADGWPQCFGIPSAASSHPRIKQGWMCCLEGRTRMHSTGYVDSDRIIVAILTEGSTAKYGSYGRDTVSGMARAVMPGGHVPLPYSFGASRVTQHPSVRAGTLVPPVPPAVRTNAAKPSPTPTVKTSSAVVAVVSSPSPAATTSSEVTSSPPAATSSPAPSPTSTASASGQ